MTERKAYVAFFIKITIPILSQQLYLDNNTDEIVLYKVVQFENLG
jgi:hypothetical protein